MKFDLHVSKKKTNLCIDRIIKINSKHYKLKLFIKIKKRKTQRTINSNMECCKSQQGTVTKEIEKIA